MMGIGANRSHNLDPVLPDMHQVHWPLGSKRIDRIRRM